MRYSDRVRRERILDAADSVVTVCEEYTSNAFFLRNRYMVDRADVIVCCFDGKTGGTAYTVEYARRQGRIIIQLNPTDMVVTVLAGEGRLGRAENN